MFQLASSLKREIVSGDRREYLTKIRSSAQRANLGQGCVVGHSEAHHPHVPSTVSAADDIYFAESFNMKQERQYNFANGNCK